MHVRARVCGREGVRYKYIIVDFIISNIQIMEDMAAPKSAGRKILLSNTFIDFFSFCYLELAFIFIPRDIARVQRIHPARYTGSYKYV